MTNKEIISFAASQPDTWNFRKWLGNRDSDQMWAECNRPEWLLWWASLCLPFRELTLAACDCAETALRFVPDGEDRPRLAIETARRWARGEATLQQYYDARAGALAYAVEARRQAAVARRDGVDAYAGFAASNCGYNMYAVVSSAIDADKTNAQKMCQLIRTSWPECPLPEVVA